MSIDKNQVKKVAKLSRISLDDRKLESLSKDLDSILNFVEELNKLDTNKTQPLTSIVDKTLEPRKDKIDDGKIINQDMFNINEKDSLHKLYKKVTDLGPNLLIKSLIEIKNNELSLKDNDSNKGSYFGFPSSEDGKKFRKKVKLKKDIDEKTIIILANFKRFIN